MTNPDTIPALVEAVALIVDPVWMNPAEGPHILDNYPGQADKYRKVAKDKARKILASLPDATRVEAAYREGWLDGAGLPMDDDADRALRKDWETSDARAALSDKPSLGCEHQSVAGPCSVCGDQG